MDWFYRIVWAIVLLCVTAFCLFGFLASFEPGNGLQWQVGYGALATGGLVGAIALLVPMLARMVVALALFSATAVCVLGFRESYLSLSGQVIYGLLGCACLTGGVALVGKKKAGRRVRPYTR